MSLQLIHIEPPQKSLLLVVGLHACELGQPRKVVNTRWNIARGPHDVSLEHLFKSPVGEE